ncbi:MAG: aminotransferase class V-fold PLP-dependent enzyme, partial [Acidimicrobiales bacterium]
STISRVTSDEHIARARVLDTDDLIAPARARFELPPDVVYLNGNSLGPLPSGAAARVADTVRREWGIDLSRSWSQSWWMDAPGRIGDRIAPLIGARDGEVLVCDTTSVALAKLLGAALAARPDRHVVVSTTDNFPSDLYAAAGAARLGGAALRVADPADLEGVLSDDVAVCCMTQVDFRTGALHDLAGITAAVHRHGALMLWDLCHSAGVVPVGCDAHGVDLAVGCTYKYLHAGPGAPSFLYVRTELQEALENPIPGWLGHAEPFRFDREWTPAPGIRQFLTSSPPVVALAALDAALDAFGGLSIDAVRAKSEALGRLFVDVVLDAAVPSLEVASPLEAARRGSQVSLRHPRAPELVDAAARSGVVGDLRPPELCRFGFGPLYLSHEDVVVAAGRIVEAARSLE